MKAKAQTTGRGTTAARQFVARNRDVKNFTWKVDEIGLGAEARRVLRDAFEAGVDWQRRHVSNGG